MPLAVNVVELPEHIVLDAAVIKGNEFTTIVAVFEEPESRFEQELLELETLINVMV